MNLSFALRRAWLPLNDVDCRSDPSSRTQVKSVCHPPPGHAKTKPFTPGGFASSIRPFRLLAHPVAAARPYATNTKASDLGRSPGSRVECHRLEPRSAA